MLLSIIKVKFKNFMKFKLLKDIILQILDREKVFYHILIY